MEFAMRLLWNRSLMLLMILALTAPAIACGGRQTRDDDRYYDDPPPQNNNNPPPASRPRSLVIYNYAFNPASLTIAVGTTVVFQNRDPEQHNITIQALGIDQNLRPQTEFSYTFNQRGSFQVRNRLANNNMTATIVVQ
jgi:hypothetical protein